MRDRRMLFLGNPYLADRQAMPPSSSLPARPVTGGEAIRPMTPADARMFLGRAYDPAMTYRRDRQSRRIESIDAPASESPTCCDDQRAGLAAADWELLRRLVRAYAAADRSPTNSPESPGAASDAAKV